MVYIIVVSVLLIFFVCLFCVIHKKQRKKTSPPSSSIVHEINSPDAGEVVSAGRKHSEGTMSDEDYEKILQKNIWP